MTDRRPSLLYCLALAAGLTPLAATAQDEGSPYYVGVSQTVTRYSNLLRLADGQTAPAGFKKSDTVSSTALVAGLDQPISRQRLYGNVVLRDNRMSNNEIYDSQGYSLSAGLDWETVGNLSGSLKAAADRNLASFDSEGLGLVRTRNLQTTQQFDAVARVGVVTALTGEVTLGMRKVDYSADAYRSREFRQNDASVGVRYRPTAASSFGVALRGTEGRYPKFRDLGDSTFQEDRFDSLDLDLTASLAPSAISSFAVRLSLGRTEYDTATQRDFSGVTGRASWTWRPTGKLRFLTELTRAPDQDSYFLASAISDATLDFSRVTTALRLRADYAMSAKIALNASARLADRDIVRTLPVLPGLSSEVSGTERSARLALGATWNPIRSVRVGCDVSREQRRGDAPLSSDLGASTFGCSGQFTLQ